ncbi:MAG: glycosyltransferase family 2 protein [Clostridia bacterium]|nr:glycosyltransferase family 2 protein [Clostridia bacterium]
MISVIIPVYNVENYLAQCVESVLNQSYDNFEIILVDDGSTDSSGRMCDCFAQNDIRISVIHQKNSGPSKTRNNGLCNAKGKYICFLDSDDYLEPDAFEMLINTAESHSADLVFFEAHSFTDDGSEIRQGYTVKGTYTPKNGYDMLTELHGNNDYHCAVYLLFISRNLVENNKIRFLESAYCSEDMLFTYQIYCSSQKAVQLKASLYHRRYRSNSIVTSAKTQRHFRSCKAVYEAVRDYSDTIGKADGYVATRYTVRCAFNALDTYKKIPKKDRMTCKDEYVALKKDILSRNAFGDKSLGLRCRGRIFWFIYKLIDKTINVFGR